MTAPVRKILSLDGGGIKGVFAATFLASVEEILNINVVDYFDLIVGTSTGAIVALALGRDLSARKILDFYETYGPVIFRRAAMSRILAPFFMGRYDALPLRDSLKAVFGATRLGESKRRLVIPCRPRECCCTNVFPCTSSRQRYPVN
jgi:patatin-like phospholipase/acyl hydrolase